MAVVRTAQAGREAPRRRPKARSGTRSTGKAPQAPQLETIERPWKIVLVTTDYKEREGCQFKGMKNALLGAPPKDARDRERIDELFEFRWANSLEAAATASAESGVILVVLDLPTLGYSGRARIENAVKKAFKQFGLFRVVALTVEPSAPVAKLKYKAVFDRRDRDSTERIAAMFCEFFPEASARFSAYSQ